MLINLRNALMAGKRTPTAKDYIHYGSSPLWDGIENVAWGTHDANSLEWIDLISGAKLTKRYSNGYYARFEGGNHLHFSDITGHSPRSDEIWNTNGLFASGASQITVECDMNISMSNSFSAFLRWDNNGDDSTRIYFNRQTPSQYGTITPVINSTRTPSTIYYSGSSWTYQNVKSCAVTIDQGGSIKFYYNGANPISFTGASGMVDAMSTLLKRLVLGNTLSGDIYGLRISTQALTAQEIAFNYALSVVRFGL